MNTSGQENSSSAWLEIGDTKIQIPYELYPAQKMLIESIDKSLKNNTVALLGSPTGTGKTLALILGALPFASEHTKVIFTTRTHAQLDQVVQEFQRTIPSEYFPAVALGSRSRLCVHGKITEQDAKTEVSPLGNLDVFCRQAVSKGACSFHKGFKALVSKRSQSVKDIDPLEPMTSLQARVFGVKEHACPYYLSREEISKAHVIFMPYNYILDPYLHDSLSEAFQGAVVIIDEGHNYESFCEEALSASITLSITKTTSAELALASLVGFFLSKSDDLKDANSAIRNAVESLSSLTYFRDLIFWTHRALEKIIEDAEMLVWYQRKNKSTFASSNIGRIKNRKSILKIKKGKNDIETYGEKPNITSEDIILYLNKKNKETENLQKQINKLTEDILPLTIFGRIAAKKKLCKWKGLQKKVISTEKEISNLFKIAHQDNIQNPWKDSTFAGAARPKPRPKKPPRTEAKEAKEVCVDPIFIEGKFNNDGQFFFDVPNELKGATNRSRASYNSWSKDFILSYTQEGVVFDGRVLEGLRSLYKSSSIPASELQHIGRHVQALISYYIQTYPRKTPEWVWGTLSTEVISNAQNSGGEATESFVDFLQRLVLVQNSKNYVVATKFPMNRVPNWWTMPSVEIMCLSASEMVPHLSQLNLSGILLASGTLRPYGTLEHSMQNSLNQMTVAECPHVINPHEQILPIIITHGPSGVQLDNSFKHRDSESSRSDIAEIITTMVGVTPGGTVASFVSYVELRATLDYMCNNGYLDKVKKVAGLIIEEKASESQTTENDVWDSLDALIREKGHVLVMCVAKGKFTEGGNFKDSRCRALLMVGLPFPNLTNLRVSIKRQYLQARGNLCSNTKVPDCTWESALKIRDLGRLESSRSFNYGSNSNSIFASEDSIWSKYNRDIFSESKKFYNISELNSENNSTFYGQCSSHVDNYDYYSNEKLERYVTDVNITNLSVDKGHLYKNRINSAKTTLQFAEYCSSNTSDSFWDEVSEVAEPKKRITTMTYSKRRSTPVNSTNIRLSCFSSPVDEENNINTEDKLIENIKHKSDTIDLENNLKIAKAAISKIDTKKQLDGKRGKKSLWSVTPKVAGELPTAHQWYSIQCSTTVNQNLGRVIRHQNDWGVMLLLDHRYTQKSNKEHISQWISTCLKSSNWENAFPLVTEFINRRVTTKLEKPKIVSAPIKPNETWSTAIWRPHYNRADEFKNSIIQNPTSKNSIIKNTSLQSSSYQNPTLQNSMIQNTSLQNSSFPNTSLQSSSYQNPTLQNSMIQNTSLQNSSFPNTSLKSSSYQNPTLENSMIQNTSLQNSNQQDIDKSLTMNSFSSLLPKFYGGSFMSNSDNLSSKSMRNSELKNQQEIPILINQVSAPVPSSRFISPVIQQNSLDALFKLNGMNWNEKTETSFNDNSINNICKTENIDNSYSSNKINNETINDNMNSKNINNTSSTKPNNVDLETVISLNNKSIPNYSQNDSLEYNINPLYNDKLDLLKEFPKLQNEVLRRHDERNKNTFTNSQLLPISYQSPVYTNTYISHDKSALIRNGYSSPKSNKHCQNNMNGIMNDSQLRNIMAINTFSSNNITTNFKIESDIFKPDNMQYNGGNYEENSILNSQYFKNIIENETIKSSRSIRQTDFYQNKDLVNSGVRFQSPVISSPTNNKNEVKFLNKSAEEIRSRAMAQAYDQSLDYFGTDFVSRGKIGKGRPKLKVTLNCEKKDPTDVRAVLNSHTIYSELIALGKLPTKKNIKTESFYTSKIGTNSDLHKIVKKKQQKHITIMTSEPLGLGKTPLEKIDSEIAKLKSNENSISNEIYIKKQEKKKAKKNQSKNILNKYNFDSEVNKLDETDKTLYKSYSEDLIYDGMFRVNLNQSNNTINYNCRKNQVTKSNLRTIRSISNPELSRRFSNKNKNQIHKASKSNSLISNIGIEFSYKYKLKKNKTKILSDCSSYKISRPRNSIEQAEDKIKDNGGTYIDSHSSIKPKFGILESKNSNSNIKHHSCLHIKNLYNNVLRKSGSLTEDQTCCTYLCCVPEVLKTSPRSPKTRNSVMNDFSTELIQSVNKDNQGELIIPVDSIVNREHKSCSSEDNISFLSDVRDLNLISSVDIISPVNSLGQVNSDAASIGQESYDSFFDEIEVIKPNEMESFYTKNPITLPNLMKNLDIINKKNTDNNLDSIFLPTSNQVHKTNLLGFKINPNIKKDNIISNTKLILKNSLSAIPSDVLIEKPILPYENCVQSNINLSLESCNFKNNIGSCQINNKELSKIDSSNLKKDEVNLEQAKSPTETLMEDELRQIILTHTRGSQWGSSFSGIDIFDFNMQKFSPKIFKKRDIISPHLEKTLKNPTNINRKNIYKPSSKTTSSLKIKWKDVEYYNDKKFLAMQKLHLKSNYNEFSRLLSCLTNMCNTEEQSLLDVNKIFSLIKTVEKVDIRYALCKSTLKRLNGYPMDEFKKLLIFLGKSTK